MNWRQLITNMRCPLRGCDGMLKIPRLKTGEFFCGNVHEKGRNLDVRCLECNLRFIVTNPNTVYSKSERESFKEKQDGNR